MHGKGGQICEPARLQQLRCPLIIRSSSEDVITGELVQVMRMINPRWWLPGFLNAALGTDRFRQQVFQGLRIDPWVNHPPYPRHLLPWTEGSTQVDIEISWENPPTSVFCEAKYNSDFSFKTSNSTGSSQVSGDQLARNIRVGLHHCGYFRGKELFERPRRDFVVVFLSPMANHALVRRYRNESKLRKAIPKSELIAELPKPPFVGEINYHQVRSAFQQKKRFMARSERVAVDELDRYLQFKKGPMLLANGNGHTNGFYRKPPSTTDGAS
jgi:hypothetical protein